MEQVSFLPPSTASKSLAPTPSPWASAFSLRAGRLTKHASNVQSALANANSTHHVHSADPKINPHKDRVREQAEARLKMQKEAKLKAKAAKAGKKSAPAHNPSSVLSDKEHMDKQKQAAAQAKIKRQKEKVRVS